MHLQNNTEFKEINLGLEQEEDYYYFFTLVDTQTIWPNLDILWSTMDLTQIIR